MPRLSSCFRVALLPLLAAALFACAPARNDMSQTPSASDSDSASGQEQSPPPRRKLNPAPRRAYRITMTIADAPGPFASVEGVAQFGVTNEDECGDWLEFVGVTPRISSNEVFELRKVSDTEYQGIVYIDMILDEDYFGKGVCHWKLDYVRAELKATGAAKETVFLPSMNAEQATAQRSVSNYFWKERYPLEPGYDNFPDFGDSDLSRISPDRRDQYFSIVMTAKDELL